MATDGSPLSLRLGSSPHNLAARLSIDSMLTAAEPMDNEEHVFAS